jgi:hypothetical protein
LPAALDLALEADLLGEGGPAQKTDTLFYLSKEASRRIAVLRELDRCCSQVGWCPHGIFGRHEEPAYGSGASRHSWFMLIAL